MSKRVIKAFALAPLPVVIPLIFANTVNAVVGDMGDAGGAGIFFLMLGFVFFSYGAIFLIGIPIHLILQRFQKTGFFHYLILAALPFFFLAATIAVCLQLTSTPVPPVNPFGLYMQGGVVIKWTLAFAAAASLSATTFWYAGVRQPKS